MSLAPRLDLRQSQSLVMTPQLQQAIKLLALSNLEIEGVIAEELERNPLLESTPGGDDAPEPVAVEAPVRDEPAGADELVVAGEAAGESLDVDIAAERFDDSPSDHAGLSSSAAPSSGSRTGLGRERWIWPAIAAIAAVAAVWFAFDSAADGAAKLAAAEPEPNPAPAAAEPVVGAARRRSHRAGVIR